MVGRLGPGALVRGLVFSWSDKDANAVSGFPGHTDDRHLKFRCEPAHSGV